MDFRVFSENFNIFVVLFVNFRVFSYFFREFFVREAAGSQIAEPRAEPRAARLREQPCGRFFLYFFFPDVFSDQQETAL